MGAVAGIDDGRLEPGGQKMRRTGIGVPDNHHVGLHGFQVFGRIQQGFALFQTAHTGSNGEGIGAETFGCNVKGHPGPGAGFVKKQDDGLAPQGGDLFNRPIGNLLHALGSIQNQLNVPDGKSGHIKNVFFIQGHGSPVWLGIEGRTLVRRRSKNANGA